MGIRDANDAQNVLANIAPTPPLARNIAESENPPIYPISENFFRIKVPKVRTRYASASLRIDPWTRFNYHRPLCVIIVCLVIRSLAFRRFRKYYRRATLVRRVVLFHIFEINSLQTKGYTEISKLKGGNPWYSDRLHHYAGNM